MSPHVTLRELRQSPHGPERQFLDAETGESHLRLKCGVSVLADQYHHLREAVAASDLSLNAGDGEFGMAEISRRCGITKGRVLEGLIREARAANTDAQRNRKTSQEIQDEADKAFKAPSPTKLPYHRRASGMIDWPSVHGWEEGVIGGIAIAPDPT